MRADWKLYTPRDDVAMTLHFEDRQRVNGDQLRECARVLTALAKSLDAIGLISTTDKAMMIDEPTAIIGVRSR
jgi:hypothetical protein